MIVHCAFVSLTFLRNFAIVRLARFARSCADDIILSTICARKFRAIVSLRVYNELNVVPERTTPRPATLFRSPRLTEEATRPNGG